MTLSLHDTEHSIIQAYEASMDEAEYIRGQIDYAGCWGFIEGDMIHVYKTDDCSKSALVDLFAHELTHRDEKKLKAKQGEDLAMLNAALCTEAYMMMTKIGG